MGLAAFLLANTLAGRIEENKRRILARQRRASRRRSDDNAALEARIETLEGDLGFVTLVLASVLCRLDETGAVTQDDVRSLVAELDDVDGVADGRLDVNLLKELTAE